jgi:uncharacterized SAM-binding protein YcdF (DUF218 family)
MFFILSKLFHFFLSPFTWVFGLLIASLFVPVKYKKRLLVIGIVVMYVICSDVIVNPLYKMWEYPMVWYKDISPDYEAAIVLGGMSSPGKLPDDRTHFGGSPDRLMHALQLYRLGKVKKIIISGGSGELVGKKTPEAVYLTKVLLLCHMDTSDIIFENKSRNTRENALLTKELINTHFSANSKFLLVTSSLHMRRSIGCYEKVGIAVTAFPVDSRINVESGFFDSLLPELWGPAKWQALLHELIGYVSYRFAGYI